MLWIDDGWDEVSGYLGGAADEDIEMSLCRVLLAVWASTNCRRIVTKHTHQHHEERRIEQGNKEIHHHAQTQSLIHDYSHNKPTTIRTHRLNPTPPPKPHPQAPSPSAPPPAHTWRARPPERTATHPAS